MWFVKHKIGIFCVGLVFLLSIFEFWVTYHASQDQSLLFSFFTAFFILSIWSHISSILSNPGTIPLGYAQLNERKLPESFLQYIQARNDQEQFNLRLNKE